MSWERDSVLGGAGGNRSRGGGRGICLFASNQRRQELSRAEQAFAFVLVTSPLELHPTSLTLPSATSDLIRRPGVGTN